MADSLGNVQHPAVAGSHGAIIAREMGMPCVINTHTGSRSPRTGNMIRVDGTAGTVTVISSPVAQPDTTTNSIGAR